MFDLQAQGGMEPARYGEALKSLRDAGFIVIDGLGEFGTEPRSLWSRLGLAS